MSPYLPLWRLEGLAMPLAHWRLAVVLACVVIWAALRRRNELHNIAGPRPTSWFKGNFMDMISANGWEFHKNLEKNYGRVATIPGILGTRHLYINDLKGLQYIFQKEQASFDYLPGHLTMLHFVTGPGLFASTGNVHRRQRKMIIPAFSISNLRNLVPTFYSVAHKLAQALTENASAGPREVDIFDSINRTVLEAIGQAAFGLSLENLAEGKDRSDYLDAMQRMNYFIDNIGFYFLFLLPSFFTKFSPKLGMSVLDFLPWKDLNLARSMVDVIQDTATKIFESAKQGGNGASYQQELDRKDILSILVRSNLEASGEARLPEEQVLGQITTFVLAGLATTAATMSRILHLLATHPDVQERLRSEINDANQEGVDLSYEEIMALPILDAIYKETVRVFPAGTTLMRSVQRDCTLPLSSPITGKDGRLMDSINLQKGDSVIISTLNCNRDPAIWGADAEDWKPERWLSPLPETVSENKVPGIYSNLITFAGANRSCVGFKFAELEIKILLAVLLSQLRFSLSEKEIHWECGILYNPTVRGISRQPQMPLMVEVVS